MSTINKIPEMNTQEKKQVVTKVRGILNQILLDFHFDPTQLQSNPNKSIEQLEREKILPIKGRALEEAVVIAHRLQKAGFSPELVVITHGMILGRRHHFFVTLKTGEQRDANGKLNRKGFSIDIEPGAGSIILIRSTKDRPVVMEKYLRKINYRTIPFTIKPNEPIGNLRIGRFRIGPWLRAKNLAFRALHPRYWSEGINPLNRQKNSERAKQLNARREKLEKVKQKQLGTKVIHP
jgi:hypothetical protein